MTATKQEILYALNLGDFSLYDYYDSSYEGTRHPEVWDSYTEASQAFKDDCSISGIEALPLCNYLNPIYGDREVIG